MGTRQEGGGAGSSRPPADMRHEYDDFMPISEWREAEQSRLLVVYLPGFVREQLKVTTEGTNTLRIRGERQIGFNSNKRTRFQRDFLIPEDCNIKGIQAKLVGGILTITFPYTTTHLPPPPPTGLESKTTTQQPPQPPPATKQLEAQETTKQPPSPPPRSSQKDIQDQQSVGTTLIPQKRQPSMTLPPPKEDGVKQTGDDQKKTLKAPTTSDHQTEPKPEKGRDQITPTPKGISISSRGGQRQPPDGTIENERRREESADELQSAVKEIAKKEEERGGTATATVHGEEADGGWFKTEKYMKVLAAVKRLTEAHLDGDDRELLANMGVAALITLAFGAYIYYKLNSS